MSENEPKPSADGLTRRELLGVLGAASAALAVGLPGCRRKPDRKIVSRAVLPEYQQPGQPVTYASTWTDGPHPYGMLVKTVDGRPIKIDGNPDHPLNGRGSSPAMQAAVLSLYDPDRLRGPQADGQPTDWAAADARVAAAVREASRIVLITRSTLGPAERAVVQRFVTLTGGRTTHLVHESIHDGPRRAAWAKIYGGDGELIARYDRARVILSLDCDFLGADGPALEAIAQFAAGRKLDGADRAAAKMSRLVVAESAMTVTGSNADTRLPIRPSAVGPLVAALRERVAGRSPVSQPIDAKALGELADDLRRAGPEALVVAGAHLPAAVHAAVALLNDELGTAGRTVLWNPQPTTLPVSTPAEIRAALAAGPDVAILLDVNPVHDFPGGGFAELLGKAKLAVGHGLHLDETLARCQIALPSSHNLESWNDAAARPGVASLCQPMIRPLFDTRQSAASLLAWCGEPPRTQPDDAPGAWHDFLRARWRPIAPDERAWEECLRVGGKFAPVALSGPQLDRNAAESLAASPPSAGDGLELVLLPDYALHDGRWTNSGWLRELPDPVSKRVWDNAASVSTATADRLGLREGDVARLAVGERAIELPVLVQPGQADGTVAVALGFGRSAGGRVAVESAGVNAAALLAAAPGSPRLARGATLAAIGRRADVVRAQTEFNRQGRPVVLDGTLAQFQADADFIRRQRHPDESVDTFKRWDYSKGHKWSMAIDLGACVGCNACVTACQAENNIAVVGKEQCARGREMHWIRIDRYEDGESANPTVHQQPMLCQQCDTAPCETVCPVNATSHSPEGLNEMAYNRCVGTRYCSNNCPYKVRRFNFLRFQQVRLHDPVQELAFNPQVTVRGVGVMEKCTFCVQRINAAKFAALNADEPLAPGAVQTACQQACPANAIVFGDANNPAEPMAKLRDSDRAFFVLEELNIHPNVTYLARVRNRAAGPAGDDAEPEHHG